jgi:hypothetical protein
MRTCQDKAGWKSDHGNGSCGECGRKSALYGYNRVPIFAHYLAKVVGYGQSNPRCGENTLYLTDTGSHSQRIPYWLLCERELAATRNERRTALRGQDRHIPVIRAEHGISAAEQPMQCYGEPDMSIIMHPAVIISSVGSVDAAGGLCVQKTECAQLRLTDGHGCDP